MNKIEQVFKTLKREKKKAFIPYVTAGDPDIKVTEEVVRALARAGADIIEIGIPFSDPLADGPTIQRAVERSLASGTTTRKIFAMVGGITKEVQAPIVFMTYYNIVFKYGVAAFIKDAKKNGASGLIVPDLPMEESDELIRIADKEGFCVILLTAPTTPLERFRKIAVRSRGFIYYVSLTGITGARKALAGSLADDVKTLKKVTSKPVCVGFGVSTPAQAGSVAKAADGVIIGSALISVIEKNLRDKKKIARSVGSSAAALAKAIHSVRKA